MVQICFERVYLFKRGQVEHILTKVNMKLKASPFTPRPNKQEHACLNQQLRYGALFGDIYQQFFRC